MSLKKYLFVFFKKERDAGDVYGCLSWMGGEEGFSAKPLLMSNGKSFVNFKENLKANVKNLDAFNVIHLKCI